MPLALGWSNRRHPSPPGAIVVVDAPEPIARSRPGSRPIVSSSSTTASGSPERPRWSSSRRHRRGVGPARARDDPRRLPLGADRRGLAARRRTAPGRLDAGGVPRVLVCFGGSDPHDVTGSARRAARRRPALGDRRRRRPRLSRRPRSTTGWVARAARPARARRGRRRRGHRRGDDEVRGRRTRAAGRARSPRPTTSYRWARRSRRRAPRAGSATAGPSIR